MNPPGTTATLFAPASDVAAWRLVLANAFWTARLKHFCVEYRLSADYETITTVIGTDDMPDELQQLVVKFAALEAVRAKLLTTNTSFRVKSGAQEFETQQGASFLTALLKSLMDEMAELTDHLTDSGYSGTGVGIIDLVLERNSPFTAWVGA